MTSWTFFTNHAHALFCLAADPDLRIRDLSLRVGITERAAQRIVSELADAGVVEIERVGRRNRYRVNLSQPLRHPVEAGHTVGELVAVLARPPR